MNPNPDCKDECLFRPEGPAFKTMVNYTPVYDKQGNNINVDGNTTFNDIRCLNCGKIWKTVTRYGKTTYEEKK